MMPTMARRRHDREGSTIGEAHPEYGAAKRLSATEAARNFSELLNRVRYRGERFVIERAGIAIGELRPVAPTRFTGRDLLALMRSLPAVDTSFFDAVEEAARSQQHVPEAPWEP